MRGSGVLWFAVRVAVGARSEVAATAALAVSVIVLTFLALATVGASQTIESQRHRRYGLTPRTVAAAGRRPPAGGTLRTIEPRAVPVRRWHGHEIVRAYYSGGDGRLPIPGVARPPRADEYYASPALTELMRRDATVKALFSGKALAGTIGDEGLVQPHELRAVVGVPRRASFLVPVAGFGSNAFAGLTDTTLLDASVASIVLLAVWLPGSAVLVVVTRLGYDRRRRRSRTLRLLGTSVLVTRLVNALETVVVALPASLLGCLLYWALVHRVTAVPWTSFGYFTEDADPRPAAYALAATAITAIAAGSQARALRMEPAAAGAVDARPPSRTMALGLALMSIGIAYLFALPALTRVFPRATLGLWIACGCVSAGLATAGPRVVMKTAGLLTPLACAGGTLVGLRLSCRVATTPMRLGSVLCLVVIMLLGGLSFTRLLNGGDASGWTQALRARSHVPVIVDDFGGALSRREVLTLAPGTGAAQLENAADRHGRLVVYARCGDLAHLAGARPRGCTGEPEWVATGDAGPSVAGRGRLTLRRGRTIDLPPRSEVTQVENLPQELDGALLLPPRLAPRRPNGHGSYFYLLVASARLDLTLARLSAHSPSVQFDLRPLGRQSPDDKPFPTQMAWLTVGTVLGLALGSLALLAVVLGDVRERATRMRGLRILGASRNQLLRAHVWSTGAPLVFLGWIATSCGWLVARGIAAFDERADIGTRPIGLTALAVLVVGLAVAALTWPDAVRASRARQTP